jgi:hypothetical protein
LFQQRPSQGWGTPAQVRNPTYAARKFFDGLLKINGRHSMSLTQAAQAVQRSAFPDAYAKWEQLATAIMGNPNAMTFAVGNQSYSETFELFRDPWHVLASTPFEDDPGDAFGPGDSPATGFDPFDSPAQTFDPADEDQLAFDPERGLDGGASLGRGVRVV